MGGQSTSQGAVLDGRTDSTSTSYDLRSWQGLTEVLKLAKDVLNNAHEYAEFRNLVLAYAKQGGDPELRKQIDSLIITFKEKQHTKKLTVEQVQVAVSQDEITTDTQKVNQFALGGRRMQPRFTQDTRFVKETKSPQPQTIQNATEIDHSTQDVPKPLSKEEKGVPRAETVPTPIQAPVPSPQEPLIRTLEQHKARIAEIKRIVHERIGNPAALIDTHNEVGKKYMVALLSALKATGGGGTEGADGAMMALETVFQALLLDEPKSKESAEKIQVGDIDGEADAVKEPETKKKVTISKVGLPETPHKEKEEKDVLPEPATLLRVSPTILETHAELDSEKESHTARSIPEFEPSIFAPEVKLTADPPMEERPRYILKEDSDKVVANVLNTQVVQHALDDARASSMSNTKETSSTVVEEYEENETPSSDKTKHANRGLGSQSIDDVKETTGIDPKDVASRQTELFTSEINEALHELLHEWRVFSSSGLFGTGPGGIEHPLYINLAPLSMGEVIAGRWEGSNPKTQKSIKEYIDAWRHEQGIAYTINETFEHYLRRVVQKILKRQNHNSGAY